MNKLERYSFIKITRAGAAVMVILIAFLHQNYAQINPLKSSFIEIIGENQKWNYNLGYRFRVDETGMITQLGGKWKNGQDHTVRLYAYPAGTVLASATVTGSMNWAFTDITPVQVDKGLEYVVAVRINNQSSGAYGDFVSPATFDGLTILNATYLSNSNNMPTNVATNRTYGLVDLTYETCPKAGSVTADKTQVLSGDSTNLVVVNNEGDVQWQISANGVDFSDISGETHSVMNTGPVSSEVYYRTILTGSICSATSNIVKVAAVDPFYPLKTLNPVVTDEGLDWNYNMGYVFEVKQDGVISQLGGKWANDVSHTVRLYDYNSENQLASVDVTGSMEWNYGDITPVNVQAGEKYVVAVRLNGKNSGVYSILGTPVQSTGIEVINCLYRSRSNRMPNTVMANYMMGLADIRFEPCSYAGQVFSSEDLIEFGDSTTLTVAENIGNIQWQISADGTNFTDILGATGQTLASGAIYQTTYYRTYVTSGSCAPDTSLAFPVRVFDPLHPLQATDPLIVGENVDWDYNFGYRFSPKISGNVTELGGRWKNGIEHTVRLYEFPSGNLIASANVVGSKDWAYVPITPVALNAGNQYVVAVRVDGQSSAIYANSYTTPVNSGEITIEAAMYTGATNAMPNTESNTTMHGQPDLKFEPCVYAGLIKTSPAIICAGQTATLEVNGAIGAIQWQQSLDNQNFNNISGATDTVYNISDLVETAYFRVLTSSECGTDTSLVDSVVVLGAGSSKGLWMGLVNNDWNNPCNWGGGVVPENGDSVLILNGTNSPINNPEIILNYLIVANPSGISLSNNISITKGLHLLTGDLKTGNYNLTLEENAAIVGGFSTAYIVDNGAGKIVQKYSGAGSLKTFPVGDSNSYTPVQLKFNSGSFAAEASVAFDLNNTSHPLIGDPADVLNRYVTLDGVGISSPDYNLTLFYKEYDVSGLETNLMARFFNGNYWEQKGSVNAIINTLDFNGTTEFGSFTASGGTPYITVSNGDWNNLNTWYGNEVPNLNIHSVIVSEGDTINVTSDVVVKALNLQNNAALVLNDHTVAIKKDLVANGAIIGKGKVSFTGTELQNIDGTNVIFNDLHIDNAQGLMLKTGAYGITGTVSITSGTLFTNNALTLLSDEVYTGSIGDLSNGDVVGKVRVERHVKSYAKKWHFISSPIAGGTFEQLGDDMVTSGFPGSGYPSMSFKSIYEYDESVPDTLNDGYKTISGITAPMVAGQGYWVYVQDLNSSSAPTMVDFEGEINKGDVALPITYTDNAGVFNDGWNLVGNPYPSAIDWDSPEWTKTNISEAVYVYNPVLKQYTSYISGPTPGTGAGTNGGGRYIPSSQAFWVHAIAVNPSLIATEKVKVDSSAIFQKENNLSKVENIRISLTGQYGEDEMVVRFMDGATEQFDNNKDAGKMFSSTSSVPSLYSLDATGNFYSINSLPLTPGLVTEIPFQTLTKYAGKFELNFSGIRNFAKDFCLFLKDMETDSIIDLSKDSLYQFDLKANLEAPRFKIFVQNGVVLKVKSPTCEGDNNGALVFEEAKNMQGSISWTTINGDTKVKTIDLTSENTVGELNAGIYHLKLFNKDNNCGIDTLITVAEPKGVKAAFSLLKDVIKLDKNETLELVNESANSTNYVWDFGDGKTSREVNPSHTYLMPGVYPVKLTGVNDNGCSDVMVKNVTVTDRILTQKEEDDYLKAVTYTSVENDLRLDFENFENQQVNIVVLNTLGEVVYNNQLNLSGTSSYTVKNKFSTGIYIIKVTGKDFESFNKLKFN